VRFLAKVVSTTYDTTTNVASKTSGVFTPYGPKFAAKALARSSFQATSTMLHLSSSEIVEVGREATTAVTRRVSKGVSGVYEKGVSSAHAAAGLTRIVESPRQAAWSEGVNSAPSSPSPRKSGRRVHPAPHHVKKEGEPLAATYAWSAAVSKIQGMARMRIARRRFAQKIAERQYALTRFHKPILYATVCEVIATNIVTQLVRRSAISDNWYIVTLAFFVPALVVLFRDLRKENKPSTLASAQTCPLAASVLLFTCYSHVLLSRAPLVHTAPLVQMLRSRCASVAARAQASRLPTASSSLARSTAWPTAAGWRAVGCTACFVGTLQSMRTSRSASRWSSTLPSSSP
jgi:hypothetical protein